MIIPVNNIWNIFQFTILSQNENYFQLNLKNKKLQILSDSTLVGKTMCMYKSMILIYDTCIYRNTFCLYYMLKTTMFVSLNYIQLFFCESWENKHMNYCGRIHNSSALCTYIAMITTFIILSPYKILKKVVCCLC